jgi:hypothetical protein
MNAPTPEQEHDDRLLALFAAADKAEQQLAWKTDTYRRESLARGDRRQGWKVKDDRTLDEVAADMQARRDEQLPYWSDNKYTDAADVDRMVAYSIGELNQTEQAYTDAAVAAADAYLAIKLHERQYTGWQRYFLVTSSAGLVHRSVNCSTCNKGRQATTFALLPSCSGRSHEALVAALGPSLCSVCFPDAPVAWTDEQRISPNVATVLATQGEEAFWTALAESRAKAAKRAATKARNDAELAARRAARAAGNR